jgi:hypothetical protein
MKKIFITIVVIGILLLSINYIFFPAYLSVKSSCDPIEFEEKFGDKYEVVGKVTIDLETNETEVFIADEEDIATIKHEECHINQFEKGRIKSCNNLIGKYFNEVECYSIGTIYELFN